MRSSYLLVVMAFMALVATGDASEPKKQPDIFSTQRLPVIEITLKRADWTKLCSESRELVPALTQASPKRPFNYYLGSVKVDGYEFKSVGIRKKGFIGSLDAVRPSLKIKFNEFQKNGTYQGLSRLTLNNNKQDRSLVSQYLTYRLFHRVGVHAPRCNLCRVIVNGRDLGIYSHVESIKSPFLKRSFGSAKGPLYEGTLADFYADRIDRFQPKSKKKKWLKKGKSKLLKIAAALDQMKTSKNSSETSLSKHIDVDNFLKFWAVESLIGFWDGYSSNQNNFYIFLKPKEKRFYFIPWGADSAFTERRFVIFMDKYKSVNARALLCNRLYSDPAMRKRYLATLNEILEKHWNEKELVAEIDRLALLVKDKTHRMQGGYRTDMRRRKKFIQTRRQKIKAETKNGPVKVTTSPGRPAYMAELGTMEGSFKIQWANSKRPGKATDFQIKGRMNKKSFELKGVKGVAKAARQQPTGFGLPPQLLVSVEFAGKRSSDKKTVKVTMLFSRRVVDGAAKEVAINGQTTTGSGFFSGFSAKPIFGHLTVAAKKEELPRQVSFKLGVYEMRGMFGKARD